MDQLYPFLLGVVATGSAAVGAFFYRFWRRTRDRLFLAFAIAFWLMASNWAAQTFVQRDESFYAAIYLLRLAAFGVIIVGVVGKNRARDNRRDPRPDSGHIRLATRIASLAAAEPAPSDADSPAR